MELMDCMIDGWITCILLISISVISGRWKDDNVKLCAMEPCLGFERFSPKVGLEPGISRSAGQYPTY